MCIAIQIVLWWERLFTKEPSDDSERGREVIERKQVFYREAPTRTDYPTVFMGERALSIKSRGADRRGERLMQTY